MREDGKRRKKSAAKGPTAAEAVTQVNPVAPATITKAAETPKASTQETKLAKKAKTKKAAKSKPRKAVKAKNGDGVKPGTKLAKVAAMLQRPGGCTAEQVKKACDWPSVSMPQQAKAAGLTLKKEKVDGVNHYSA